MVADDERGATLALLFLVTGVAAAGAASLDAPQPHCPKNDEEDDAEVGITGVPAATNPSLPDVVVAAGCFSVISADACLRMFNEPSTTSIAFSRTSNATSSVSGITAGSNNSAKWGGVTKERVVLIDLRAEMRLGKKGSFSMRPKP